MCPAPAVQINGIDVLIVTVDEAFDGHDPFVHVPEDV
jgi:hypothetical protein